MLMFRGSNRQQMSEHIDDLIEQLRAEAQSVDVARKALECHRDRLDVLGREYADDFGDGYESDAIDGLKEHAATLRRKADDVERRRSLYLDAA